MPLYEFQATDGSGDRTEILFPMTQAPPLDSTVLRDGREWRRVVSSLGGARVSFRPFASDSAYRGDPLAERYDNEGRPAFNTQAELDRYIQRQKDDSERKLEFVRD